MAEPFDLPDRSVVPAPPLPASSPVAPDGPERAELPDEPDEPVLPDDPDDPEAPDPPEELDEPADVDGPARSASARPDPAASTEPAWSGAGVDRCRCAAGSESDAGATHSAVGAPSGGWVNIDATAQLDVVPAMTVSAVRTASPAGSRPTPRRGGGVPLAVSAPSARRMGTDARGGDASVLPSSGRGRRRPAAVGSAGLPTSSG